MTLIASQFLPLHRASVASEQRPPKPRSILENARDMSKRLALGAALSPATVASHLLVGKLFPGPGLCAFFNTFCKIQYPGMSPKMAWNRLTFRGLVVGGIGEELVFRGLVQDFLLKRMLGKAIAKVAPRHAKWVDSRTGQAFRIGVTAAIFGAVHLIRAPDEPAIQRQAILAFFSGCIQGAIKESRLGLAGSIGCHMAHNAFASSRIYSKCVS